MRTFTYTSGPAYGLLLDASSRGWTRTVRGSDDPVVLLMRALGVQPVADAAAAAARYGGAELRAAEEQRAQQRQARIAGLRQRFVDGPVFVMPCRGGGTSNSLGAVVIPGAGTVYFHPYRLSGACGTLAAENGVLETFRWPLAASAGARARRRRDDLRRRVDVQGRGGLGGARRRTEGRLRSGSAAAVMRVRGARAHYSHIRIDAKREALDAFDAIDSGDAVLMALDTRGSVTGRVRVSGVKVEDWEAVAVGACPGGSCIYIADIGDNEAERKPPYRDQR